MDSFYCTLESPSSSLLKSHNPKSLIPETLLKGNAIDFDNERLYWLSSGGIYSLVYGPLQLIRSDEKRQTIHKLVSLLAYIMLASNFNFNLLREP